MSGSGLLGDEAFAVAKGATAPYTLYFCPLKAFPQAVTGSVVFSHDAVGEIWYKLTLKSSEAPPVTLPQFSAPVGGVCVREVMVENPLDQEVVLKFASSNEQNFESPSKVIA
eukprot:4975684-Prorocentrum_lima.AAC.1